MPYLLGLDIGTSGAKALLCDDHGRVLATAMAEYPLSSPFPLWSDHEPADYAKLDQVLLPKDYVRLLLTGARAADAADAAGTLLLDLRTRDWSEEILGALDIPRDWLPQVYEGPQITGALLPEVAAEL